MTTLKKKTDEELRADIARYERYRVYAMVVILVGVLIHLAIDLLRIVGLL